MIPCLVFVAFTVPAVWYGALPPPQPPPPNTSTGGDT